MNYKSVTHEEAAFLIFSFKKTLRDRDALTPAMAQFYDNSLTVLREKISQLDLDENDQRSYGDRVRDCNAKIQTAWPDN